MDEFRNAADDEPIRKKSCNFTAEVNEKLRYSDSIAGVNFTQAHAVWSVFDPLLSKIGEMKKGIVFLF